MKNLIYKSILIISDIVFLLVIASFVFDKHPMLVVVISILIMYYEKLYVSRYDFWQESFKLIKSFLISFLVILFIDISLQDIMNFIIVVPLFIFYRRVIKKILFSFDYLKKRILIVGEKKQKTMFEDEFHQNWYLGLKNVEDQFDSVLIVSKGLSLKELNQKADYYMGISKEVYIVPYISDIDFTHSNIIEYSNIRSNAIQVENRLLDNKNIFIKEFVEKVLVFLMIPFLLLVHLIISILIRKDSSGRVLFKQYRLGKDDKDIKVYKYRTMYEDSKGILEKYLEEHPEEVVYYDEYHKYRNDPRITKVGRFLRKTSLDELPQIINVLQGKMSLVGPRPYMIDESSKLGKNKEFILKVKPGITGLWQVSGRNELSFKKRQKLDIWYIKNWSLWRDFIILVKTVKVVFTKVGAK